MDRYIPFTRKNHRIGAGQECQEAIVSETEEMLSEQWRNAIEEDKKTLDKMVATGGEHIRVADDKLAEFSKQADVVNSSFTEKHPEAYKEFRAILAAHGF